MSFKQRWFSDKLEKKAAKGLVGYPVATVAFYGPDDRRASKVAVSIILEGTKTAYLERWYLEEGDVRTEPQITEAILRYVEAHKTRSVLIADRINGCPHEEGRDYPMGEKCPRCQFWATHDRWTGEAIQ